MVVRSFVNTNSGSEAKSKFFFTQIDSIFTKALPLFHGSVTLHQTKHDNWSEDSQVKGWMIVKFRSVKA